MKVTETAAAYAQARKRVSHRQSTWADVAIAYDDGLRHALSLPHHQQRSMMRLMRVLIAANREVTRP